MDHITIRSAERRDASALAALSGELGYPASAGEILARLIPILNGDDNAVLVACTGKGNVVAWIHVFRALRLEADEFAEIGGLVVAEGHRRQGIAKELLVAAEKWAVVRGIHRIRVRSRVSRDDAHALYRHLGFTHVKDQEVFEKEF